MEHPRKKKHAGRIAGRIARAVVAVMLLGITVSGWIVTSVAYMEQTVPPPGYADAIVVLGAQVKAWGVASEALLRRMQLALSHYQENPRLIICCGGQGADEPCAEGDFMRDWLIAQGVPPDHVVSENTSRNTRENIAGAQRVMQERGLAKALVVTSDYHLPRALEVCRRAGLPATGDGSASRPDLWWKNHLRESLSWVKFLLGM